MNTAYATPSFADVAQGVRDVFVQVTRYPAEVLDPNSGLEEDLGIDSVKLGEIFAVLRQKYALPEKLGMPREKLKTIAGISETLAQYLRAAEPSAPAHSPHVSLEARNGSNGSGSRNGHGGQDILPAVRNVFAQVTRYPVEVLDPHSNLEEDLGIDSVKLGEVFAVLRQMYELPEKLDLSREQLKTIHGIAESLHSYLLGHGIGPHNGSNAASAIAETPSSNGVRAENGAMTLPRIQAAVLEIFVQVTRYPVEVLDPDSNLEEDLGIDSVKLGEVFAVLRQKFELPERLDLPREKLRTIHGVADSLYNYLQHNSAAATNGHSRTTSLHAVVPAASQRQHRSSAAAESFTLLRPELKPFAGKVALITGSGRGLGKDIALYLAELGATVIVNSFHSRNQGAETVKEIEAAGGKAIHAWGSVANPEHVDSIFKVVESTFGGLDFFISNASNGMLARLEDITPEHWEKAFRTNLVGLHQSALRAVALMKKRGGGKIITLSSPASHGYVDYFGCMGAVKAAVESLTKSMAIEFSAHNIQVNCVSPGPIYGDLLNKWPESERLIARWEQATTYERLCIARDVSHFIAYLLSEPVKLFAGSVLVMDGGISVRWG